MTKTFNWIVLVAGTFIMIYIMTVTGRSLYTAQTPHGILDLEFAYNSSKTHSVLDAWTPTTFNPADNIKAAIKNTWLDFIFLFFYSLFLFYTCKTISESFSGRVGYLGRFFAMCALNAGLLDIGENTGMLITLNGFSNGSLSMFTTILSVTKWALALSALAYTIIAGTVFLFKKIKNG